MFIVVLLLHEAAMAKKIRTIGVSYIAIHGYIHPSHPNPETVFFNISMGSLAPEMTIHLQWLNCEAAVGCQRHVKPYSDHVKSQVRSTPGEALHVID